MALKRVVTWVRGSLECTTPWQHPEAIAHGQLMACSGPLTSQRLSEMFILQGTPAIHSRADTFVLLYPIWQGAAIEVAHPGVRVVALRQVLCGHDWRWRPAKVQQSDSRGHVLRAQIWDVEELFTTCSSSATIQQPKFQRLQCFIPVTSSKIGDLNRRALRRTMTCRQASRSR